MNKETKIATAVKTCPVCGKPSLPEHKPFCSKRCADVDLNRWLSGVYRIPTNESPTDEDIKPADTDQP